MPPQILASDLAIYLATENAFLHRMHFFYSILQQNVRQSDSIRNVGLSFCFSSVSIYYASCHRFASGNSV